MRENRPYGSEGGGTQIIGPSLPLSRAGLQVEAMTAYIKGAGWDLVRQVKDVGSGTQRVEPGPEGSPDPGLLLYAC